MSIGAEKMIVAKVVSLAVLIFAIPVSGAVKGMALVPGGKFEMGSFDLMDSGPVHQVELDSFYIDLTEVTVAAYRAYGKGAGKVMPAAPDGGWKNDHPMVNVTWADARDYCAAAGKRLPTEAEWEKAARGTDSRIFPWLEGKAEGRVNALDTDDGFATTAPVGSFPGGQSPYGAMDMAGNVWEWCADWYDKKYYAKNPAKNPQGPEKGTEKVYRGGAWNNTPYVLQSASRGQAAPDLKENTVGFRCAK